MATILAIIGIGLEDEDDLVDYTINQEEWQAPQVSYRIVAEGCFFVNSPLLLTTLAEIVMMFPLYMSSNLLLI